MARHHDGRRRIPSLIIGHRLFSSSDCSSLRWWNGSQCRDKGLPAWKNTTSARCNDTSQCADYNLVSCPLGLTPGVNGTCECGTTSYWVNFRSDRLIKPSICSFQNGLTCVARKLENDPCISWPDMPLNMTNCLNAAGAGLLCNWTSCVNLTSTFRECTGGICYCPPGSTWNSTFAICAFPPPPG